MINTDIEAQMVENRVRVLKKEEEKMVKKINEARRQAASLMASKEANNERF